MRKLQKYDVLLIVLFVLQMGFHTPTGVDEELSLGGSIFITLLLCAGDLKYGKIRLNREAKHYCIWYTLFFVLCLSTLFFGVTCNKTMLKRMLFETFIPSILCLMSICAYLKRAESGGIGLLQNIVYAEVFVAIRAIIYTPIPQLIREMNTMLYGSNLGVNYNNFTTSLTLTFCIGLYLAFYAKSRIRGALIFIFCNILFSGSRKAIIVSILCFMMMYYLTSERKHVQEKIKKIAIILVAISAIVFLVFTNEFMYDLIGSKLLAVINSIGTSNIQQSLDASVRGRAMLRETAWETFLQHPLYGVGYYSFMYFNSLGYYAHNNYLEILADLGIIGFAIYYCYYCYCILMAFKMRKRNKSIEYSVRPDILLFVFILGVLILEYGQVTYFRMFMLVPFMTVILGSYHIYSEEVWGKERV
ncbi:O-antigen ligase family protein [Faecalicoccus pleomorphus]|uniref:O-antigen ligase family protein n=1 Tax=Faecalicoccus pleomorphus TaxID=1323 RepID=UPI0039F643F4